MNNLTTIQAPVYDKNQVVAQVTALHERAAMIVAAVDTINIITDEDAARATELTKQVKVAAKEVDEQRENNWRPYKAAADEIAQAYKPLSDSLKKTEDGLKTKLLHFAQQKQLAETQRIARERKEREDAALAEASKIMAEADNNAETAKANATKKITQLRIEGNNALADMLEAMVEKQVGKLVSDNAVAAEKVLVDTAKKKVEVATTQVKTETAQSYVTKTWDFEILDAAAVPVEFCLPDAVKLRAAVRNGTRDIPGVRVFEKESISVR